MVDPTGVVFALAVVLLVISKGEGQYAPAALVDGAYNARELVAVPKSSFNFDTPRLNFVFSDRRVVRSKLIILVEIKKF